MDDTTALSFCLRILFSRFHIVRVYQTSQTLRVFSLQCVTLNESLVHILRYDHVSTLCNVFRYQHPNTVGLLHDTDPLLRRYARQRGRRVVLYLHRHIANLRCATATAKTRSGRDDHDEQH